MNQHRHHEQEPDLPPPSLLQLQHELNMQLNFIDSSCALYDQGYSEEALRIAPAAATILYPDPRLNYHCLAKQLLAKEWRFLELFSTRVGTLNTAQARENKAAFRLLLNRLVDGACLPVLDAHTQSGTGSGDMHYLRWLEQPIIYFHHQHRFHCYNRGQIIRLTCNKIIPALLPPYLKNDIYLKEPYTRIMLAGHGCMTLTDIFTASLRQIGYELLNSQALNILIYNKPVIH